MAAALREVELFLEAWTYIDQHPDITAKAAVPMLAEHGIDVTEGHFSATKSNYLKHKAELEKKKAARHEAWIEQVGELGGSPQVENLIDETVTAIATLKKMKARFGEERVLTFLKALRESPGEPGE